VHLSSQLAIAAVMLAWLGFAIGAAIGWRRVRRAQRPGPPVTRDSLAWIGFMVQACGFALVWGFQRLPGSLLADVGPVGEWCIAIAGAGLAFAGAGLGAWAILTLGRQFAVSARVSEGHELVTVGPYAYVRNPIYLALGGLLLATGLALSRGVPLVLGCFAYVAGTLFRARREEGLLRKVYGATYEAYGHRVPRLLPWPLSRRRGA
jgi:protein-S-isoprenylcysteine O-methyltransferase Ste14